MGAREKVVGAYLFHNSETQQFYVGSSKDLEFRKNTHEKSLKDGNHPNRKFQHAYNHNPKFDFVPVLTDSKTDALNLEQAVINDSVNNPLMLNISKDARYCSVEHSEETRQKLREANIGKKHTEESKRKIGEASKGNTYCLGIKYTAERKQQQSLNLTGRPVSKETREKIKQANTGYVHSDESKEKNRLWHTGRPRSPESSAKCSEALKGVKKSPAHAAKIRLAKQLVANKISIAGVIYDSLNSAARELGVNPGTIHYKLNSGNHPDCHYL